MLRYALPGAVVVGVLIALLAGSLTPPANRQGSLPPVPAATLSAGPPADQNLAAQHDKLQSKVQTLSTQITQQPKTRQDLPSQTAQANPDLKSQRDKLQAEVQALNAQVTQQTRALNDLRSQTTQPSPDLKSQRDKLESEVQALDARVAQQTKTLSDLRTQTAQVNQDLKSQRDKLQGEMQSLTDQIAQAKKALADLDKETSQSQRQQAALHSQHARARIAAVEPPAAAPATDFNSVQNIVARLRHHALPAAPSGAPAAAPPVPAAPSPSDRLMAARQAIAAGDTSEARQLIEAAQTALVFQPVTPDQPDPAPTKGATAAKLSQALEWLNAGQTGPAMHELNLAIANLGANPVSTSAYSAPPSYPAPAR